MFEKKLLLAVSVTAVLKLSMSRCLFGILIFKGEEWSKLSSNRCSINFCDVGVLEFLQTEPDPYIALILEAESEGHHSKLMVTSNISSWKSPRLCNVHT